MEPCRLALSLAFNKRKAKALPRTAFKAWWQDYIPDLYQPYQLKVTAICPDELQLPRKQLQYLLAARSGYRDFTAYHERFAHDDAQLNCSCGRRKSPDHPFYCRKVDRRHRIKLGHFPKKTINRVIGQDFVEFDTMIESAHFFQEICPYHRTLV